MSVCSRRLIILELPHPRRPVLRLDAADCGPDALGIEIAVPIQCPKLLEADFPDVEIHEYRVYVAVVPVDAYQVHFVGDEVLDLRRSLCVIRIRVPDHAVEEQRYGACLLLLPMSPEVLAGPITKPFIHAVAAVIGALLALEVCPASSLGLPPPGSEGHRASVGIRFGCRRAQSQRPPVPVI